jgi:hypothetical protein
MKRRNRYPGRSTSTGFSAFIVVIILAVAVGYAGTKYIIYPHLLGTHTEEESGQYGADNASTGSAVDVISSAPSIIIDQQDVKEGTPDIVNPGPPAAGGNGPYCVQFGSFSAKAGAETMSAELSGHGIYSYVYESGGSYKVLGLPYSDEAKAREAADIVSAVVSDVFVVDLSKLIQ